MRLLACGDAAVLVEVDDLDTVVRLAAAVQTARHDAADAERTATGPDEQSGPGGLGGLVDVVPAARTVLLRCRPGTDLRAVARAVHALTLPDHAPSPGEEVRIPVVYDGEDLDEVARLTGLDPAEVVARHQDAVWRVAFTGFAPGFGYLVGGDGSLQVPRREESRTRVPAGAVGLAGEFTGVYPRSSPGGWQLIGRTDLAVWDPNRDPPALLRPGVRVRFAAVDR